jgi:glyceraldehyde 3-phosphate dehydrogenase
MIRVGINGFGRIGRCLTRHILQDRADIDLVQINASGSTDANIHLLKYDTVHGRWIPKNDSLKKITWTHERNIQQIEWDDVDIVLECTGAYNDGDTAYTHIDRGAKKVLISAPAINVNRTVVYGVNHNDITVDDKIISNASCTTNCLAPLVKVLDGAFGIVRGQMTTIHSYTGDQGTIDKRHRDLYRARAAGSNMIPTSTGAANALKHVYPPMEGKIKGSAIRVPTLNVSCVDLTIETREPINEEMVNRTILNASKNGYAGIIGYEEQPLVSSDYNTTSESCIFAPDQTRVVDNKMVRMLLWYDNEWAFSCRMADVAAHMMRI